MAPHKKEKTSTTRQQERRSCCHYYGDGGCLDLAARKDLRAVPCDGCRRYRRRNHG